jgi:hypothetical protein
MSGENHRCVEKAGSDSLMIELLQVRFKRTSEIGNHRSEAEQGSQETGIRSQKTGVGSLDKQTSFHISLELVIFF